MSERQFDRSEEDVGNILNMEHINLTVPDQQLAALFYVSGLGFTRDPYIDFGAANMWINAGEQQFHLPKREAQRFRGHIGVVVPDLDDLRRRLDRIGRVMEGTEFAWHEENGGPMHIAVTCPWGNDIRAHGPGFGTSLGIPFAEVRVPRGSSDGIARFYREVFNTPARVGQDCAEISMGGSQWLTYRETDDELPAYDGHHIAIYVSNFSGPHSALARHDLISEESDQHQYRFQTIVDPDSGNALTELEHEVRSLKHPMFKRHLVNRNPAQSFFNYTQGRDSFQP